MNIIINGGSKGIGREVVLHLAKVKDNQILVTGRNEAMLKELQMECVNENVSYLKMDISELSKGIEAVKDQIYNRFSVVDILINVAGSLIVGEFMKLTDPDSRKMMETNFFGPATFIRLLVPLMPAGSHIVNISSMGGFQGSSKYRGLSVYSASKAALSCLSECLAGELSDSGISVNCLALGSVQTGMFENAFPGFKAPLGSKEMAEFISYFAVNGHKYFNGKVLPVAVSNP
ncbi:MAG TPA: short-chain dehydrogenase [Bacteroidales bacterium]|nr:short-chain dehydrogenase [Bacteroidales bacterium]HBZ20450.1 short-chain dehydrogenase [Bacteroidales bacterium]